MDKTEFCGTLYVLLAGLLALASDPPTKPKTHCGNEMAIAMGTEFVPCK